MTAAIIAIGLVGTVLAVAALAFVVCRGATMSEHWHLDDDGHYRRRV